MPAGRRDRDGAGADLVFGLHAVRHALSGDAAALVELWVDAARQEAPRCREVLAAARQLGLSHRLVTRAELDRETGHGRHQGVALWRRAGARPAAADLEDVLAGIPGTPPLILVLDQVQDPHNLGACARSADAAGANAVVVPRDGSAPLSAVARKSASGALDRIPVIRVVNLARALRRMQECGIWVVGAAHDAKASLYQLDLTVPLALVMGGEGAGLRRNVREHCDHLARLPMAGGVESLNVSVAAGICLFEAVRQRRGF
jgi:23S rRNA (guanosine2251-2'-O)-methyltransferase